MASIVSFNFGSGFSFCFVALFLVNYGQLFGYDIVALVATKLGKRNEPEGKSAEFSKYAKTKHGVIRSFNAYGK